jgi:hypothetical protein
MQFKHVWNLDSDGTQSKWLQMTRVISHESLGHSEVKWQMSHLADH